MSSHRSVMQSIRTKLAPLRSLLRTIAPRERSKSRAERAAMRLLEPVQHFISTTVLRRPPKEKTEFVDLPRVVLLEILRKLSRKDRHSMSQTCSLFRDILCHTKNPALELTKHLSDGVRVNSCERGNIYFGVRYKWFRGQRHLAEQLEMARRFYRAEKVHLTINPVRGNENIKSMIARLREYFDEIHLQIDIQRGEVYERYTRKHLIQQFMQYPDVVTVHNDYCNEVEWSSMRTALEAWGKFRGIPVLAIPTYRRYDQKLLSYVRKVVDKNGRTTVQFGFFEEAFQE